MLISSCSSPSVQEATETASASASAEIAPVPLTAELDQPIPVTCYWDDCIGEITIAKITIGENCETGIIDFGEESNADTTGKQVMQVWGELEVIKGREGQNGESLKVSVDDPKVIDGEGFTQNTERYHCQQIDNYESWVYPVRAGQKARIYGDFLIPEGAKTLLVEDYEIELPKPNVSEPSTETEVPSEMQTSPSIPEPIFSSPGVGYRCGGTDAWVFDPANCIAANLGSDTSYDTMFGPDAAIPAGENYQDLSQIPIADGGTCPAYLCGYGTNDQGERNPTSGEIQSLHGCQEGYISDQELCDAVAWVEDHQY
ncbi:hypothetical protein SB89_07990 [Corynebacterium glutamicum]|nr:hypothetical protein SB89_07990 [Corynebacterium glutamicum]OKX91802.1 hypothetical protein AUP72_07490 [Corynebacterium glutamicum]TWS38421.1 hypothetical protein AKJ21_03425 [Corynebacterium glutamicum]